MATKTNPDLEAPIPEWITRFVADIPSAVALFDCNLRYVTANNRWLNAFGVVGDALIGQHHDHVDAHGAPILFDLHRRALSGETVQAYLNDEDELNDGASPRIVSAQPHHGPDGAILGVIVTMHEALAIATDRSLEHA